MAGTMHLPIYEQLIYRLTRDDAWDGNVEALTGAWCALEVTPTEGDLISIARGQDATDTRQWWLVTENSDGILSFVEYTSAADLKHAERALARTFDVWENQFEEEVL